MTEEENAQPIDPALETARTSLAAFLKQNPTAKLKSGKRRVVVERPWDDETLEVGIPPDSPELIDALNSLYLPPRLTAVWHSHTRDLEVIFTAFPIEPTLRDRNFEFQHRGQAYQCGFGKSSDRLIRLAAAARPIEAPTETDHRNLQSFYLYDHSAKEHPDSDLVKDGQPTSFWIRDVDYDGDAVVELVRELNFFMRFADPHSPTILVHQSQSVDSGSVKDPFETPAEFPTTIRGRELDTYLLGLWESSAKATDPFRQFIYLYQILEYCAFYHVQEEILRVIRRAIQAPDALDRVGELARDVLDTVVEDRLQEAQKFSIGIERCVKPSELWNLIEPNAIHFSEEVNFDGGFCLPPLINSGWTAADFQKAWSPKFADSLRKIRNALVHARESRQVGVIAPSRENYSKLAPWLPPLKAVAMQAMIYSE